MSKTERRFGKGILSFKDIAGWARGSGPADVHDMLQALWEVQINPPKIVPSYDNTEYFSNEDVVYLGVKSTNQYGSVLRKLGINHTLDNILKSNLGEEETHYMSFHTVPSNFHRQDMLGAKGVMNRSYADFMKAAALGVQIEGIGFLGRKHVSQKIGIPEHYDIEKKMHKKSAESFDAVFTGAFSNENIDAAGMAPKSNQRDAYLERANQIFQTGVLQTVSAAGQFAVSDGLEKDYAGRMPELIRKTLEPENRYGEMYAGFIGENYPNFKAFLDGYLR
jgi:hypothetical protein